MTAQGTPVQLLGDGAARAGLLQGLRSAARAHQAGDPVRFSVQPTRSKESRRPALPVVGSGAGKQAPPAEARGQPVLRAKGAALGARRKQQDEAARAAGAPSAVPGIPLQPAGPAAPAGSASLEVYGGGAAPAGLHLQPAAGFRDAGADAGGALPPRTEGAPAAGQGGAPTAVGGSALIAGRSAGEHAGAPPQAAAGALDQDALWALRVKAVRAEAARAEASSLPLAAFLRASKADAAQPQGAGQAALAEPAGIGAPVRHLRLGAESPGREAGRRGAAEREAFRNLLVPESDARSGGAPGEARLVSPAVRSSADGIPGVAVGSAAHGLTLPDGSVAGASAEGGAGREPDGGAGDAVSWMPEGAPGAAQARGGRMIGREPLAGDGDAPPADGSDPVSFAAPAPQGSAPGDTAASAVYPGAVPDRAPADAAPAAARVAADDLPVWLRQVVAGAAQWDAESRVLTVQVSDPDLGRLQVRVSRDEGGVISLEFHASRPALAEHIQGLAADLEAHFTQSGREVRISGLARTGAEAGSGSHGAGAGHPHSGGSRRSPQSYGFVWRWHAAAREVPKEGDV